MERCAGIDVSWTQSDASVIHAGRSAVRQVGLNKQPCSWPMIFKKLDLPVVRTGFEARSLS